MWFTSLHAVLQSLVLSSSNQFIFLHYVIFMCYSSNIVLNCNWVLFSVMGIATSCRGITIRNSLKTVAPSWTGSIIRSCSIALSSAFSTYVFLPDHRQSMPSLTSALHVLFFLLAAVRWLLIVLLQNATNIRRTVWS